MLFSTAIMSDRETDRGHKNTVKNILNKGRLLNVMGFLSMSVQATICKKIK